jgi:hypothetical protein
MRIVSTSAKGNRSRSSECRRFHIFREKCGALTRRRYAATNAVMTHPIEAIGIPPGAEGPEYFHCLRNFGRFCRDNVLQEIGQILRG